MHPRTAARFWHGTTLGIGSFALIVQVILVVSGASVLVEDEPPTLGERMVRLVGYFTIQANVLVAATAFTLVRDPARDGRVWRVIRLAAWLAYTLIRGAATGWYPSPFLNLDLLGAARVAGASVGVTGLILVVSLLVRLVDQRLPVRFPR